MGTHAVQKGPVADRIAENVKVLRQRRRLSHRELSQRLTEVGRRILPSGLVKIEDGSRRVDVDDLVALALALRVPLPRLLLPGTDTGTPVELTADTSLEFAEAWRWARGELLPGAPPVPDEDDTHPTPHPGLTFGGGDESVAVRGELLPGVPPVPEGDRWVKIPTELWLFIRWGHPDLFDRESMGIDVYQSRLSAVLHAPVAEIDFDGGIVRFRPRKRTEKAEEK
jgi:transcriptional regulator with XRE-family HTH domain